MYIIDQLVKMSIEDNNDIKRILSSYFLRNAHYSLTLQNCIKDTGISKSAIYNFFNEAGFNSFKEFTRILHEESIIFNYHTHHFNFDLKEQIKFDEKILINFVNKLKQAKKIYLYGNQKEINLFQDTILVLIQQGHSVRNLNKWDINYINSMISHLKVNDVLIIIDTNYRLNVYYDIQAVNPNMINLDKVNVGKYQKFYIGKRNIEVRQIQNDFEMICIDNEYKNVNSIWVMVLDKYVSKYLRRMVK